MNKLIFLVIAAFAHGPLAYGQTAGEKAGKLFNSRDSSRKSVILDSARFIPKPVGWTNDFAKLFSRNEVSALNSLISAYEKRTTIEISVATVDSTIMGPIDLEPYSLLMLRTWGVGKKATNNGILIVIAPHLRRVRIQNGYGIEKFLSNKETEAIISAVMMPQFRNNRFFSGTKDGILAIIGKLDRKRE